MDYSPETIEKMTKSEIQELSYKLYGKFCKVSEHLISEKLLLSYYEKDETYAKVRVSNDGIGPLAYCWNRTQERIEEFTQKIQNLKDKLSAIADVYDARFPDYKTRRTWET